MCIYMYIVGLPVGRDFSLGYTRRSPGSFDLLLYFLRYGTYFRGWLAMLLIE